MTIPSASATFRQRPSSGTPDDRGDGDQDVLDLLERDAGVHRRADVQDIRCRRRTDGRTRQSRARSELASKIHTAYPLRGHRSERVKQGSLTSLMAILHAGRITMVGQGAAVASSKRGEVRPNRVGLLVSRSTTIDVDAATSVSDSGLRAAPAPA